MFVGGRHYLQAILLYNKVKTGHNYDYAALTSKLTLRNYNNDRPSC